MKTLNKYDKLLKFMYGEFNRGNDASGYGEHIRVLIDHFECNSQDNRIGDALDKIGVVRYYFRDGLIDAVDTLGKKITEPTKAYSIGRMQPTQKGRDYLQQRQMYTINAVASASGTLLGKLLKSLFGK